MSPHDLSYRILGVDLAIQCPDPELRKLVQAHWGHMAKGSVKFNLSYAVTRDEPTSSISIARAGQPTIWATDEGQFLFELEAAATIAIQLLRHDLYFLHAAVGELDGQAYLFVAESGGGKSTTLWGLLHHGWSYVSDELAPIDLATLQVHAYPRALCLKRQPPEAYPLPVETKATPSTLHVPVADLPRFSNRESCPLAGVYFVKYCPEASSPAIHRITPGEAAARLYANTLNHLAHANVGLDAAVRIAKAVPGFALASADLAATCALVGSGLG